MKKLLVVLSLASIVPISARQEKRVDISTAQLLKIQKEQQSISTELQGIAQGTLVTMQQSQEMAQFMAQDILQNLQLYREQLQEQLSYIAQPAITEQDHVIGINFRQLRNQVLRQTRLLLLEVNRLQRTIRALSQ